MLVQTKHCLYSYFYLSFVHCTAYKWLCYICSDLLMCVSDFPLPTPKRKKTEMRREKLNSSTHGARRGVGGGGQYVCLVRAAACCTIPPPPPAGASLGKFWCKSSRERARARVRLTVPAARAPPPPSPRISKVCQGHCKYLSGKQDFQQTVYRREREGKRKKKGWGGKGGRG